MFDFNLNQLSVPLPENTDVVNYKIKVNEIEISQEIEIQSIGVERLFNRVGCASIIIYDGSVSDQSFPVSDQDTFSPGNEIEILTGYMPEEDTLFKGVIVNHSIKIDANGRPKLTILCKDKAVKMTMGRKNRYFFELSDSDIITSIASDYELTGDIESTDVSHDEMVQYFCTDWDFILTRAEANGKLVLTNNRELIIKSPDFDQEPEFTVTYGTSLFEFEAEMDARRQFPGTKASAWDSSTQSVIDSESSGTNGGGLLGGGLSSSISTIGGAFGSNLPGNSPNTDYSEVLGQSEFLLQHSGQLSQEELQSLSDAQLTKGKLARSRGRMRIEGTAQAIPGITVSLQGVGARHSGPVFITAIRHEISDGGWYTHMQFGLSPEWLVEKFNDVQDKPAAKLLPGINGLQIGIVTKLENDPMSEHRIQIRLPLIDETSDGIWARIALQDAGENRSAFFLPELGDEVIVGFLNDDPRDPIVLGMVNSSAKPSPFVASDDNHQKGWQTRSGIKAIYDDDKISWTLETPGGKKIIVDDDADIVSLEDQNSNKITLDSNGITIEAGQNLVLKAGGDVTVEGVNITQTADAEFSGSGSASAKLESSGEVVVSGGLVRVN